jgi:hypothetical protein
MNPNLQLRAAQQLVIFFAGTVAPLATTDPKLLMNIALNTRA